MQFVHYTVFANEILTSFRFGNLTNFHLQMSRENAIKFLREISLGIEYLENSYANRGQNDQNTETVRRVN